MKLITGSSQEISSNVGNYIRNPKDILTSSQTQVGAVKIILSVETSA